MNPKHPAWPTDDAREILAAILLTLNMIACGLNQALAGPIEDSVFAAFEALCIWPINKPDQIAAMVQDVGATTLNQQEARPFLNGEPGRAWIMRDKNARLLITLTNEGVCRVFGPDASGQSIEKLIGQHLRSIKFPSEQFGSDIQNMFAVTYPDPAGGIDLHLLVGIGRSDLASLTGAWLVAVPERVLAKELSRMPPWP
jgi:hypothetical protein